MPLTPHSESGPSSRGGQYAIEAPAEWNGTLLLFTRGLPMSRDDRPFDARDPLVANLLADGYAVAGVGGPMFWPLEQTFANATALLDRFEAEVGKPERTIAWGFSIGGIMTAGLVELFPERLSGALPLCGNLAGAVGIHNRELDMAFVVQALLGPDSGLEIARISDPAGNLRVASGLLEDAQRSPQGRARLGLAAAVGGIPGWYDPHSAEPAADDYAERLRNQVRWFEEPGFLVFFMMRADVERQAGGNPSWNDGVDYGDLLSRSAGRAEVEALYGTAGLDLAADLGALAAAPRVAADPEAVAYLERHIVFSGDLGGVPVLTLHTTGDGLVQPDNEDAYRDVVESAGQQELLRQLYLHRGGHCTHSIAEFLVSLRALETRIETGEWPTLEPETLNAAAAALGEELNVLSRGGGAAAPAFVDFEPGAFSRPHDARSQASNSASMGTSSSASTL
ncbi:MAG: hypothetical protein ABR569_03980 [Gaiellaceae bacterium]